MDILTNHSHLECFKKFLINNGAAGAEIPLHFWLAVEDIKLSADENDPDKYAVKLEKIKKVFLHGNATSSKSLGTMVGHLECALQKHQSKPHSSIYHSLGIHKLWSTGRT